MLSFTDKRLTSIKPHDRLPYVNEYISISCLFVVIEVGEHIYIPQHACKVTRNSGRQKQTLQAHYNDYIVLYKETIVFN